MKNPLFFLFFSFSFHCVVMRDAPTAIIVKCYFMPQKMHTLLLYSVGTDYILRKRQIGRVTTHWVRKKTA